jgi:hypothetical protein
MQAEFSGNNGVLDQYSLIRRGSIIRPQLYAGPDQLIQSEPYLCSKESNPLSPLSMLLGLPVISCHESCI